MRSKRWIPLLVIVLFAGGIIWKITRKPPPEIPRFPTVKGKVFGIDHVTLLVFLPVPDLRQVMLFVDFQKEKYKNLARGFDIHFFNDFRNTPTSYPFTREQMKYLCATHTYNPKEGIDQFSWIIPPESSPGGPHF